MHPVQNDIKEGIKKCVDHLKQNCKSKVIVYSFDDLCESGEMCAAQMLRINMTGSPNLLEDPKDPKVSHPV